MLSGFLEKSFPWFPLTQPLVCFSLYKACNLMSVTHWCVMQMTSYSTSFQSIGSEKFTVLDNILQQKQTNSDL